MYYLYLIPEQIEELQKIAAEEKKQYNQLCLEIQELEAGTKDSCLDELWDQMIALVDLRTVGENS